MFLAVLLLMRVVGQRDPGLLREPREEHPDVARRDRLPGERAEDRRVTVDPARGPPIDSYAARRARRTKNPIPTSAIAANENHWNA